MKRLIIIVLVCLGLAVVMARATNADNRRCAERFAGAHSATDTLIELKKRPVCARYLILTEHDREGNHS